MSVEKTLAARPDALALPTPQEWQTLTQLAEALFRSGLLPAHIKSVQAALAVVVKGRELGIPAMQALGNIVVVNGKPTCNAELMLALVYRDHGDDALHIAETTADRCTVSYKRRSWAERRTYSFTMADAQRAGLAGSQTWQKYPQALLRARCISAVARMAFPDSIAGMYGYEEMGVGVAVEDDGGVVLVPDQGALAAQAGAVQPAPHVARVATSSSMTPDGPPAHSTLDRVAGELAAATAGAHDGHPATRSVEEAKRNLKEACLSIGLPAPAILREVNALAARYGVPIVGSSAGVTAVWLDRIRTALPDIPVGPLDKEHMTEQATLLEALRAACRVRGRDEPRSLAQLNELATEIGLGSVSSWQTVSTRWLEALRASLQRQWTADRAPAPGTQPPATDGGTVKDKAGLQRQWTADRAPAPGTQPPATDGGTVKDKAERSFAGWIAAAPEGLTLDQLAADVLRARAAGTITDKAAEALLEAVDARGAELAAANLYPPDQQQQGEATEQSGGDPTAVGREIEAATAG